ncbi:PREDICTED: F-box only protein 6-like [Wasmannia auropunctata]|uniref:F-box only protein 6-like n=1 Tax=Wasmannia auropunctata TaxID=64793 RepID=UPI0005ED4EB9|nr:PREDICTED: F-box only protein 6-like [Wasmannia auropunctata]XP_011692497.1 PREDICTED: F-box only protein 6-like [Wasmannia auropunctata]
MMGQFNATPSSPRVMFDEKDDNGLTLCDKYLPKEMIIEILCYVDCNTLMDCGLVCKRWKMLMNSVWRKKMRQKFNMSFAGSDEIPWSIIYFAFEPYNKNLLKYLHCAEFAKSSFNIMGYKLSETARSISAPCYSMLDDESKLQTRNLYQNTAFAIRFATPLPRVMLTKLLRSNEKYIVHLTMNRIDPYILDTYQPPIVISEWYNTGKNTHATYILSVKTNLIDRFLFEHPIRCDEKNWMKVSHVFKNYGPGLKRITFEHSVQFHRDAYKHCGPIIVDDILISGASVCVQLFEIASTNPLKQESQKREECVRDVISVVLKKKKLCEKKVKILNEIKNILI